MMPVVVVSRAADGEYLYHRYDGRRRTHRFGYELPLEPIWVEEIRVAPSTFEEAHPPESA